MIPCISLLLKPLFFTQNLDYFQFLLQCIHVNYISCIMIPWLKMIFTEYSLELSLKWGTACCNMSKEHEVILSKLLRHMRIVPWNSLPSLNAIFSNSCFSKKYKYENELHELSFRDRNMWFSAFYWVINCLCLNRELFFILKFFHFQKYLRFLKSCHFFNIFWKNAYNL